MDYAKRTRRFRETLTALGFSTYEEYLQSPHWKYLSELIYEHYGQKCLCCGARVRLEIHHLTYERIGRERLSDLRVVCRFHHELIHKLDKFIRVQMGDSDLAHATELIRLYAQGKIGEPKRERRKLSTIA